jgi:excisionase family DNA binding protein
MAHPDLQTITEASRTYNVSRSTLEKAIKDGRVRAEIVLGRLAVRRDDVARLETELNASRPRRNGAGRRPTIAQPAASAGR